MKVSFEIPDNCVAMHLVMAIQGEGYWTTSMAQVKPEPNTLFVIKENEEEIEIVK